LDDEDEQQHGRQVLDDHRRRGHRCLDTDGTNKLPQPQSGSYCKVGLSKGYWDESSQGFAVGDEDNCHSLENGHSGTAGYGTIVDTMFSVDSTGHGT
jgi:hypothetical protein